MITSDRVLLGQREIGWLLGVSSNRVHMWAQRCATNGFPLPVAARIRPAYPGDKQRTPLWDLMEVVWWQARYHPNTNRGAHWKEKR